MVSSSFSPFHKPQQDLRVSVAQISDQRSCLRDWVWWELALVLLDVCHVLGWLKCLSLPFSNYYGMTKWIVPTFCSSSTMNRPSLPTLEHPWLIAKENLSFGGWGMLKWLVLLFFHSSHSKTTCIINYKCVTHCMDCEDKIGWPMMMLCLSTKSICTFWAT